MDYKIAQSQVQERFVKALQFEVAVQVHLYRLQFVCVVTRN